MHTPRAEGCSARANIAATSASSSNPSTRVMPYCLKTADVIASLPARCPECDCAQDRPISLRPTLIMTIGTRFRAASSAASIRVRPSLKPSR